jgi:hypothetical protein
MGPGDNLCNLRSGSTKAKDWRAQKDIPEGPVAKALGNGWDGREIDCTNGYTYPKRV